MHRWNILNNQTPNKENIISLLLKNRGIETEEEKDFFINPPTITKMLKKFPKEFIKSLADAKKLVDNALKDNIPIVIYGDYDADGICATAILQNFFSEELSYKNVISFIPNRFDHGYGLSTESIDSLIEEMSKKFGAWNQALMITVDTGITAVNEVIYAKEKGFTVILTDHHQKPDPLPPADCLVWSDEVVGSSISWILSRVLGSKDPTSVAYAAVATITDVQPVIGINRSIVRDGLEIINNNPPIGIKALMNVSNITNEVTTYHLGWVIGPRLNATGRILDASAGLELLTTKNYSDALDAANKLNKINTQRQDKTIEMYNLIDGLEDAAMPKIIITANEDFHEGIVGLVASRLVRSYSRPSIVISLSDGYGKGSVRSVRGVNIIDMLREYSDLFENLGGHPMAAGFTIKQENIELLKDKLILHANSHIADELLIPELDIDLEVPVDFVDLDLLTEIEKIKPFGIGNSEPVFVSRNLGVAGFDLVGRDKSHLSLKLFGSGQTYKGIFFGGSSHAEKLNMGDKVDVVYTLNRNEYRGNISVDLLIKDLKVC